MKMMKRFTALIIVLLLILPILGCNGESGNSTPTENAGTTLPDDPQPATGLVSDETALPFKYPPVAYEADFSIPESGLNAKVQCLPEKVENPDDLPVLKWVCIADRKQTWTEDAVHELNQMFADRNMPFRVQFTMLTADVSLYTEWFRHPEAQALLSDADLIWAWMTQQNQQEYLMPITEYVTGDAKPTLKNAVIHELNWTGGMVDGEIYGIQTYPLDANSHGWRIQPEVLTKYGLTKADFDRSYWEMDAVFEKIYKENGHQPFLYASGDGYGVFNKSRAGVLVTLPGALHSAFRNTQQNIGLTFGIDFSGDPTVVNTLETDTVRRIHEAHIRYKDAGYMTSDGDIVKIYYCPTVGSEPYSYLNDLYIPVTDTVFDNCYDSYSVCGVAAGSQRKEEAISLLNLIAEDEEFRHQLLFGKEGRDYTLTDGSYSAIKRNDGAYYNMEFLSMYSVFDSVRESDAWPISYEGMTKLQTYLECMESVSFCYYPARFDFSGLETEIDEYAKVLGEYCSYFTSNVARTEIKKIDGIKYKKEIPRMDQKAYNEMLQILRAAGGEKIVAELQQQLDEWLTNNPDWQ